MVPYLKGQYHEIFDPSFFSLNGTVPLGSTDSWAKAVLNIDWNSRKKFEYIFKPALAHESGDPEVPFNETNRGPKIS
jgi:hypothetical protein